MVTFRPHRFPATTWPFWESLRCGCVSFCLRFASLCSLRPFASLRCFACFARSLRRCAFPPTHIKCVPPSPKPSVRKASAKTPFPPFPPLRASPPSTPFPCSSAVWSRPRDWALHLEGNMSNPIRWGGLGGQGLTCVHSYRTPYGVPLSVLLRSLRACFAPSVT